MRQRLAGLGTALALALTLWFILDRLRIIVWVSVPWWGLLILGLVLFLAIDYLIGKIVSGR